MGLLTQLYGAHTVVVVFIFWGSLDHWHNSVIKYLPAPFVLIPLEPKILIHLFVSISSFHSRTAPIFYSLPMMTMLMPTLMWTAEFLFDAIPIRDNSVKIGESRGVFPSKQKTPQTQTNVILTPFPHGSRRLKC